MMHTSKTGFMEKVKELLLWEMIAMVLNGLASDWKRSSSHSLVVNHITEIKKLYIKNI